MDEAQNLQEVEERLDAVERQSHHLALISFALIGLVGAAALTWRARRRRAAALPRARRRTRLRAVPSPASRAHRTTTGKAKASPRKRRTRS